MSNPNAEIDVIIVAQKIRGYLINHPKAADSLEGIISWWLNSPQSSLQPEVVRDALNLLQSKALIVRRTLADGNTIYMATRDEDPGEPQSTW